MGLISPPNKSGANTQRTQELGPYDAVHTNVQVKKEYPDYDIAPGKRREMVLKMIDEKLEESTVAQDAIDEAKQINDEIKATKKAEKIKEKER